jgi:hypothetical protein
MMSAGPIDVEWWEEALAHLNRFADSLQNDARALATIVGDEIIARTERLSRNVHLGPNQTSWFTTLESRSGAT